MLSLPVNHSKERGDTLIEVLLALSVFGIVTIGAFSLMNRGVVQMYDSMERSEVRMLINSQTEVLTYMRDEYIKSLKHVTDPSQQFNATAANSWATVRSITSQTSIPALDGCEAANSFWVGTNLSVTTSSITGTSDAFPSPGNGIWMQKIAYTGGGQPYIDFYVKACWRQNSNAQTQVLSTVVRLYDK